MSDALDLLTYLQDVHADAGLDAVLAVAAAVGVAPIFDLGGRVVDVECAGAPAGETLQ